MGAGGNALADDFDVAVEKNEEDRFAGLLGQIVAIGALQGRAGADGDALVLGGLMQRLGEGFEPGPAVDVGERDAGAHLFLVGGRMVAVAIEERGVETPRDRSAAGGLAGGGNAHRDNDASRLKPWL